MKNYSREKYWDLGIPVKSSTGTGSNQKHEAITGKRANKWECRTEDGKLTFWGVYILLLLRIQNARKWIPSTCENYDNLVCNNLAAEFMEGSPAFEDLTEDEMLIRWQKTLNHIDNESIAQRCHFLLRIIMLEAYERGYTRTLLWGMVNPCRDAEILTEEEASEDTFIKTPEQLEETDERVGKRYAQKLNNKTCMLPETEYCLYMYCEQESAEHGEYVGGLIALEIGGRTSEICGYSYEDLDRLGSSHTLRMLNTADSSGRNIHTGGKSSNAPRGATLTKHLINLLLSRRAKIEAMGIYENVGKLPIVCVGTDYAKRCTQKELNRAIKDAFYQCKVESDVMREASTAMRDNSELAEECENSASLYLFRHQRITWAVACGYSQAEIYNVAGHKIEVPNVEKSDFSNPDIFERQVELDRNRPLKQIIDNVPAYDEIPYEGTTISAVSLGWVQVRIPAGEKFKISAEALEPGSQIDLEPQDGIEVLNVDNDIMRPINPLCDISMRELFHNCAQGIRDNENEPANPALVGETDDDSNLLTDKLKLTRSAKGPLLTNGNDPTPVSPADATMDASTISDLDHEENIKPKVLESTAIPIAQVSEECTASEPIDSFSHSDNQVTETLIAVPSLGFATSSQTAIAKSAMPKNVIHFQADGIVLLVSNQNTLRVPEDKLLSGAYASSGHKAVSINGKDSVIRVFDHNESSDALLLTPEGKAFRVSAGTSIQAEPCSNMLESAIALLPLSSNSVPISTLVIVSKTGRLWRVPYKDVSAVKQDGSDLVDLANAQNEQLAVACFCPNGSDVLLISSDGQALCLHHEDVYSPDMQRNRTFQAMKLRPGAQIVACLPYSDAEGLLCVSKGGNVLLTLPGLPAQHKGAQGVSLMTLTGNDAVAGVIAPADGVLIACNDGTILCLDSTDLDAHKRSAKGRCGIKPKSGRYVVGILPLVNTEK